MSTEKLNDPVFFKGVVKRLADSMGCKAAQRHVAKRLGLSEQDFANRKKRGTLSEVIASWCLKNNVSLDHVFGIAGEEADFPKGPKLCGVRRARRPMDLTQPEGEIARLVGMAWSVLESGTTTAEALRLNIVEFYDKLYGGQDEEQKSGQGGQRGPAPKKNKAEGGA